MDKQKQIEEMANDVRSYYHGSEYDELEDDISFSGHLVNLGWIKLDENAVVLTEEEYERLLKEETLCERLGNDIDVKLKYIYELEDKVAQVRKETAEKFAERVKAKLSEWLDDNEDLNFKIDKGIAIIELIGVESLEGEVIVESLIDEICKEIIGEEK